MSRSRLPTVILALAVVFGIFVGIQAVALKEAMTHDEAITFLAATGHQKEFTELSKTHNYPIGRWVEASEWKQFLELDRFFCFRKIASDLARYDIHPPLYFWLLHAWIWIVGMHLWSAVTLNMLITVVTTFILYRFAVFVLEDRGEASVVAFTWAVSPYIWQGSVQGRPYGLLALFGLLLVWLIVRSVDGGESFGPLRAVAVSLITLGGALTHYHFVLVVVGASVYAAMRLIRKDRRKLAWVFTSQACGYVLFLLVDPYFYHSFSRQQQQSQPAQLGDLSERLIRTAVAFSDYFPHPRAGAVGLMSAFLLILLPVAIVLLRRGAPSLDGIRNQVDSVLFFFVWLSTGIVLLYVGFVSPVHAMGPKYLSMAWPFFVFVPVLVARLLPWRAKQVLLLGLCLVQLSYAAAFTGMAWRFHRWKQTQRSILESADLVVVDTVARGVLPRVIWDIPDQKLMYAASPVYMVEHPETWIDRLGGKTIYASNIANLNSEVPKDAILTKILERHSLWRLPGGIWGIAYFIVE